MVAMPTFDRRAWRRPSSPSRAACRNVGDELAEGLVGRHERGEPGLAVGEQTHRAVRVGVEDGVHGGLDDVEVAPLPVQRLAVGPEYLGEAGGAALGCGVVGGRGVGGG